jgi:hypothetical protein
MPLPSRRECARSRGGWRYTPIPVLLDSAAEKLSRLSDNLPYAIRSRSRLLARGAGTVLISTTNLVTLPAPPSCYCVCRLQPPPLCAACSAFAAAVALLVLCLSIVCVPVCLLLSVRVCLREPLHVCMSEIVYQGVSFALLLSAPRVASSRHRRCCLQFQSCRRLREEAARCVVRQNSFSNSFQVAAHQCPHQPSIRCNRRRRAFRKLTEL